MSKWKLRSKSQSSTNSSATIRSNLVEPKPYKDIILSKIYSAVTYSILIYVIFVVLYVGFINCIFRPPDVWIQSLFFSIATLSFWFYILPFVFLIFFKTLLFSKHSLTNTSKDTSIIREFITSAITKAIFLVLHTVGGGFAVWLYLSLSEDHYSALYAKCGRHNCLQEGGIFLILNGAWNGLYFYIRTQSSEKMLLFPVIQRSKFRHFKSEFLNIVNESKWFTLYPTIYFTIVYITLNPIVDKICSDLGMDIQHQQFGISLYFFAWIFSSVYVIHSNVFDFIFKLFLTEQVHFPLAKNDKGKPSLSDALSLDAIPIIQQLACLDLYLLSKWSSQRRQSLYTLSQPGGHPRTWNQLIDIILRLINNFTETLNNNLETVSYPDLSRYQNASAHKSFDAASSTTSIYVKPHSGTSFNTLSATGMQTNSTQQVQATVIERLIGVLNDILDYIKNIGIFKQIFGGCRDINVQNILKFGQSMELLILALTNIVHVSVEEDPYGVIQRDVPEIITTLLQLKNVLEKLNKSSVLVKKNSNDLSLKMSHSVYNATKRSLIKICRRFKGYLHEFKFKKEIVGQLRSVL